jgi:hypothetical protein
MILTGHDIGEPQPLAVQLDPNTSTLMEMEFAGPRP